MQTYIQDIIVPPASNLVSTPKAVRQEMFQLPEQPIFTQEVLETSQPLNDVTNTSLICPTRVSLLRANSCSRENIASKLVKEIFTAAERMNCNVKR